MTPVMWQGQEMSSPWRGQTRFSWRNPTASIGTPAIRSECLPDEIESRNLSHYDASGAARMVDVGAKAETRRTARAHAFVRIKPSVLRKLPQNPKGNPLEVARFAGIQAAKRTSELIPMCHPLMLSHVDVDVTMEKRAYA